MTVVPEPEQRVEPGWLGPGVGRRTARSRSGWPAGARARAWAARLVVVGHLVAALAAPALAASPGPPGAGLEPAGARPGRGIVRFHVVAHSDGARDQALKLAVRDALLEAYGVEMASLPDPAALEGWIARHGGALESLALRVLAEGGAAYGARLEVGWEAFPETHFGPLVFPQGRYRTLRLILGEGAGQNWWCVLFPPLCVVAQDEVSRTEVRPEDAAVPASRFGPPPGLPEGPVRVEWRWSFLDESADPGAEPLRIVGWWEEALRLVSQGAARLLGQPAHAGAPEEDGVTRGIP